MSIRCTDERSSVTSVRLRLLAITDIAFLQKISGTERLRARRRSDEGETAERDDSRIKRIVFAVRYGGGGGGGGDGRARRW